MKDPDRPLFFYDLGSPYAYLAAERVNALFAETRGEPPEWRPILLGGLFKRFGRDSWARGEGRDEGCARSSVAPPPTACRRSAGRSRSRPTRWWRCGRQPMPRRSVARRPSRWRHSARPSPPAATSPSPTTCCSPPPPRRCTLVPSSRRSSAIPSSAELREATELAGDLGVRGVPSVVVGGRVFWGDDRLEEAAALS